MVVPSAFFVSDILRFLIVIEHLQGTVPQYSRLSIYRMGALQERKHGSAAVDQLVHRNGKPHIAPCEFHPCLQCFNGVFTPARSVVNFRKV